MDTKSGNCSEKCENNDKVGHHMTSSSSSSTNSENCPGCGLNDLDKITITVAPTTGGRFEISVQKNIAIENLKKVISKKLKVPKERILLLHKDRQLRDGSLHENSIAHGSTLTLLPSVETGLLSQRPEQGVMQALESLNDSQVNDFLSGKAPLNLTMRLGDHMMLIQLQLSSVTPPTRKSTTSTSQQNSKSNETYLPKPNVNVPSTSDTAPSSSSSVDPDISLPNLSLINSKLNTLLHKNNENLNALKRKFNSSDEDASVKKTKSDDDNKSKYFKDLNLKNVLLNVSEPSTSSSSSSDAKSTKYSDMMKESTGESSKGQQANQELQAKKSKILSQIMENVRKISENTNEMTQAIEGKCDKETVSDNGSKCNVACTCSNKSGDSIDNSVKSTESAALDTKALAEASRNLTQTLKQLSSEALTCRSDSAEECSTSAPTSRRRPGTQGAIIESMHHNGKGVFSGTFSGTLNPALQDRFGRPKRDISTIIHILNDLLCATPQYRRQRQPQPQVKVQTQEASTSGEGNVTATELVSIENEATRGKLERLRMVMEQNRARRRARREAKTTDSSANELGGVDELENSNQDGAELMEISPPEPVVA